VTTQGAVDDVRVGSDDDDAGPPDMKTSTGGFFWVASQRSPLRRDGKSRAAIGELLVFLSQDRERCASTTTQDEQAVVFEVGRASLPHSDSSR